LGEPPQPTIELLISPSGERPIMTGDRNGVMVATPVFLCGAVFRKAFTRTTDVGVWLGQGIRSVKFPEDLEQPLAVHGALL